MISYNNKIVKIIVRIFNKVSNEILNEISITVSNDFNAVLNQI